MNLFRVLFGGLFSKRDDYSVYSPKERIIYEYFDGEKTIKADPIVLYKRVMEKRADILIDTKVANSASKDASKAHNNLMDNLRWVFSVKKIEDSGLTDPEVGNLFDHFMIYCDRVKKNSSPSPISSNSSEVLHCSSEGDQHILSSSVSGSKDEESNTVEPASSL